MEPTTQYLSETEEDQLYYQLRELPDFLSYPLPNRWYKKYNIIPLTPQNTKQFLESNHTFNCMFAPKDLTPIIIDEPQKDLSGNVIQIKLIEEKPIEVETITRPFDPKKRLTLEDNSIDHQQSNHSDSSQ